MGFLDGIQSTFIKFKNSNNTFFNMNNQAEFEQVYFNNNNM